jgi:aldehyde:ferredoxin oxidoreductase
METNKTTVPKGGYVGKYCIINLTTGKTEVVEPGDDFYRKYLGGYGLGAAVITERQPAGIDALSPESHVGICTGLLTGTGCFFAGRFMVVGKSPLTGGWGDANSGGFLSKEMKAAGYDAIFFTGAAEKPVWVLITESGIEIKDAGSLWGKDAIETEESIREILGDKKVQVACIGQSGERLSRLAGVVHDGGRIAARSGLGAVMGSKKLKAVAVRGNKKVPVAYPEKLKAINSEYMKEFKQSKLADRISLRLLNNIVTKMIYWTGMSVPAHPSMVREILKKYGTTGNLVYSFMTGDTPIKNWSGVGYTDYTMKSAAKNSDESILKRQKKKYACQGCPLGCGGIIDIEKGRYAGTQGHKIEYETVGAFGGLTLVDDSDTLIELNEMCNRAGIDTISTGAACAFAIDCFEHGILSVKDTGGIALKWGNGESILKLTEMIINREGLGDLLADGVKRASERIGKGSEAYAVHAGGQELPLHDPRNDAGYAIAYQCEPTPGRHTIGCYMHANLFRVQDMVPKVQRALKRALNENQKNAYLYTASSIYMQLMNGCGMCLFGRITSALPLFEYLNAVTGWEMSADEYYETGERILSLRKAFNVREGITPQDQKVHALAIGKKPLESGPNKGKTVDIDMLQGYFFQSVGWEQDTGKPTPAKMRELGLDQLFGV